MFERRRFLKGTAAFASVSLSSPYLRGTSAQPKASVLRYVPQSDLSVIDPHGTPAYTTRDHAMMIFDTLYGVDGQYRAKPQMVEGHVVENDGKSWTMTLRPGLKFHDGEPVRGRDVVASLKRWMKKDNYALALADALDELSAPEDKTIRFRLKRPFSTLPDLLGKMGSFSTGIMPERLAQTDVMTRLTELVGSGPYRYLSSERVAGSRNVYERFAGYVPRQEPAENLSGGKIAHFDRVEWHTIPDPSTAAAALQAGEIDWWGQPTADLLELLTGKGIKAEIKDRSGYFGLMRFNCLQKPFDDPAIRRIVLGAVNQEQFMLGLAGDHRELWRAPVGFFHPDSPLASKQGLETFSRTPDYEKVKKELYAAGYKGEPIVVLSTADLPAVSMLSDIGADLLQKIGMNVDLQVRDWATISSRMKNKGDPAQGGFHVYCNNAAGAGAFNPAAHTFLRSNGENAFDGWPSIPEIEDLRDRWLQAETEQAQIAIGHRIEAVAMREVPYIPLGLFYIKTAYRSNLTGMLDSFPLFWNVRRA